jgi:hypothetical protein
MLSFSISYPGLIKLPYFADLIQRGDRGWKEAQRQAEDRMTLRKTLLTRTGSTVLTHQRRAGVNQQPPVQDEAVQAVLGWTKNTSSSPAQGFFSPLLCPKNFPSYLLPPLLPTSCLLPPSPHFLPIPSPKLGRAPKLE